MKVILNKDLSPLGEEGDVRDVARGYARNFLFPREIAVPYNDKTVKLFEARREEIEARKVEKRKDAAGQKEKLESLSLEISMPAGANGKLYGAVTSQTIADELARQGYQIERKRIELPGLHFKSIGKYRVSVKLYESSAAEIPVTVIGQEIKTETRASPARPPRRRRDAGPVSEEASSAGAAPSAEGGGGLPAEALPPAGGAAEVRADAETPAPAALPEAAPPDDAAGAGESVPAEAAAAPEETASGDENPS
jgi:large subunit ribosomal protein L9